MCGIAGVLHFNSQQASPVIIKKMTDAMAHRGPNSDGFFVRNQVSLGHRRLSIIDLSASGNQPFVDASGNFQMVFNGELYNYNEVKRQLPGISFKSTSDTEVLTEYYARAGIKCIEAFKGMFAFAVWDIKKEELLIARDRLGVKPLYYYKDDDVLVFASEIRAILASGFVKKPGIDSNALIDYFSYQSVGSPLSMVRDIHQLPAAHYIKIKGNKFEIAPYWDITSNSSALENTTPEIIKKNVRSLLLQSVEGRMISDVPIGAFLSGGIDSSAVVGLMAEISNSPVSTFNISFSEKEYDESYYAELVAKKFKTNHHKILLKPEVMLEQLENALNAMDLPSGDGINTYVVSKEVKNAGLTVALSGIGGDELFAGYPIFKKYLQLNKYSGLWNHSKAVRHIAGNVINAISTTKKLQELLNADTSQIKDIYPVFRRIFNSNQLTSLLRIDGSFQSTLESQMDGYANNVARFPLLSQVSISELMGYTQHTLLKDTDQMSMAFSLEVREPFFDHELISYVLRIPDSIKYPHSPKQLLVDSLGEMLPKEIVHRPKQGFSFPWSLWMKNELRGFCEKNINSIGQRSFINNDSLQRLWKRFLKADPSVRWMELWLFVILEHWIEKNGIDE